MGRLIIDDTTIYELDEECMKQKEREERAVDAAKKAEGKASIRDRVKERPAP